MVIRGIRFVIFKGREKRIIYQLLECLYIRRG